MSKDRAPIISTSGPEKQNSAFTTRLLHWHQQANSRQLPWKGERDPYRIWLSEIILQQTRAEQGLAYYQRFITAYPTIEDLAAAPDDAVFKLWEGLGYYSRCRNLLATARAICAEHGGRFPADYALILSLKGIGSYTAAAIASFAFDLPHAVLDGNVYRVLARFTGCDIPIDSTAGRKHFTALANQLLDPASPALYNQAIMDFGATVCKPQLPVCNECILNDHCQAYLTNRVDILPVKSKKTAVRKRWFTYFIFQYKNMVALYQRRSNDIWQQLYEFPQIETHAEPEMETVLDTARERKWIGYNDEVLQVSIPFRQLLSHQQIHARFIRIELKHQPSLGLGELWLKSDELERYALPRIINRFLDEQK